MWLLVRNPDGGHVLFPLAFRTFDIDEIKRGYRKLGGAVVAVYRRKPVSDAFARHED